MRRLFANVNNFAVYYCKNHMNMIKLLLWNYFYERSITLMTSIIFMMVLSAVMGGALWMLYLKEGVEVNGKAQKSNIYIVCVLAVAFIAHIIGAACYYGHKTDMSCFNGWSVRLFSEGLGNFYDPEQFSDYPPGYVYVMYILGAVKSLFKLEGTAWQIVLKLPAMSADIVMGYLVYRLAEKRFSQGVSAGFAALIALNPVSILNSAVWGQIDSILALFCVLAVYFAAEKKLIVSFFMFAAAVLIKPQALFFTPVLLCELIDEVFVSGRVDGKIDFSKLLKLVGGGLCAVAAMIVTFIPFGVGTVFGQYIKTLGEYNYMTVNAFNIYGALGKNWEALNMPSTIIGYGLIAVVVAYSVYVFFKSKSPDKHYISAFILAFGTFMLSVKMHERYAFPGMIMLLFALVCVPETKRFTLFGLFSLMQYFNTAWILFIYEQDINKYFRNPAVRVGSLLNIALAVFAVYVIEKQCVNYRVLSEKEKLALKKENDRKKAQTALKTKSNRNGKNNGDGGTHLRLTEKLPKFTKADAIAMAVIAVVYAAVAFYNLGDMYAPQTYASVSGRTLTVDLGEEKHIAKTEYYLGARQLDETRNLQFRYLDENRNVVMDKTLTSGSVFYWNIIDDAATDARYVEISTNHDGSDGEELTIMELCFLDGEGEQLKPVNTDESTSLLFDEQEYMAKGKSFMSGTYFDEIYHARTAYEFIHHLSVYEWTHPPLGKVLMGIGILIFGMVPFGWRFIGTFVGVLMVPLIYAFGKKMLKHSWLAVSVCLLFTFDFMHFAQTRIATIDVYVTFFIMLMYYFMYKYYKMSFYDTPLKKTFVPLGLSGIFFGLGVASKWTGLYAGAGLAVIFFYTMYIRYAEYKTALKNRSGNTDGIENKYIIDSFGNYFMKTILFCIVMFIAVPAVIYTLSYIPYFNTPSGHGISTIFQNAESMYTYHSKTVVASTHPYSSHWYEWPIMYRPIWYFSNTLDNGLKQGISSFGNPAVWWTGIAAVAYMAALTIIIPLKKRRYFGYNKYALGGLYTLVFALLCAAAYAAGSGDDKLVRLFPCVVFYSVMMVGIFFLMLYCDDFISQKNNGTALFLLVGYLAELMPWMGVMRTTYIYHYFPCVPFTVLMIGYGIKTIYDNMTVLGKSTKILKYSVFAYAALAIILFIMFYPVLSGSPCSYEYAEKWLKWFSSWVLL